LLDFIYYPVSAILWFWHEVFGTVLGPASGYAWGLAIVFLVFTLRAVLFMPFVQQVRSMRKMQEVSPRIKELREKHGHDQQQMAQEMQKLQAETGFNPLLGCLPMLVQIPVFIGLFHVLRGFTPGAPSNFVFDAGEVSSFVHADFFGARLANMISENAGVLGSFGTDRTAMLVVGVPMMIAAGVATHFTARHSVARQTGDAAAQPQAAVITRLTLWVFPVAAVVAGPFLPLAILLYWLANNFWTLAQQWVVYRRIDREEAQRDEPAVVVDSAAVVSSSAATASTGAGSAAGERPSEVPGVIEDKSRGTDEPDEVR